MQLIDKLDYDYDYDNYKPTHTNNYEVLYVKSAYSGIMNQLVHYTRICTTTFIYENTRQLILKYANVILSLPLTKS